MSDKFVYNVDAVEMSEVCDILDEIDNSLENYAYEKDETVHENEQSSNAIENIDDSELYFDYVEEDDEDMKVEVEVVSIGYEDDDNTLENFYNDKLHLKEGTDCLEVTEQQWHIVGDICTQVDLETANDNIDSDSAVHLGVNKEIICNDKYSEKQQDNDLEETGAHIKQELLSDASEVFPTSCVDEDNEQRYLCYECQQVFSDLESAEQHDCPAINEQDTVVADVEQPQSESKYLCNECGRVFGTSSALANHSRAHKSKAKVAKLKAPFSTQVVAHCEICNTTFGSERNLKLHIKIHNKRPNKTIRQALPVGAETQYDELNQFYCEICNKSFDENLLLVHKNMHQNVDEYNCAICNRQFENLSNYEMHMKMHRENKCNAKRLPSTTKTKQLTEAGKICFPCQYCGREFARPYEKVKHERVHTGEKPYECEVCGKTFRVSYSLTLHLRTHTNIRPYVCATCDKRFKSQPVYAHHLKTHLNERDYKCDICGKCFRTSVLLGGHKNIHTKPFNCLECNRPFSTLNAVKLHMKTHNKLNNHEGLKYRCNFCGAEYARSFALQSHIREQHAMAVEDVYDEQEPHHATIVKNVQQVVEEEDCSEVNMLIAAATEAECGVYMKQAIDSDDALSDAAAATSMLSTEEQIVVDNFHTEEIVSEWLTK